IEICTMLPAFVRRRNIRARACKCRTMQDVPLSGTPAATRRQGVMMTTDVQADAQREKQIREAEELLFTGPQTLGVAKGLFLGRFVADLVMPYPTVPQAERAELESSLRQLRAFLDGHLDPADIDRQADIPRGVIDGLARLGVYG